MITLNNDNVESFLKTHNYAPQKQKETDQLYLILPVDGRDYPVFFKIYEGGDLLQMILFFPVTMSSGAEGDLARLLHTLNKEIDLPGFGMDEATNVVYYRIMIPALEGQIQEELIEMLLKTLPVICQSFAQIIYVVGTGKASYQEIMKKISELKPS